MQKTALEILDETVTYYSEDINRRGHELGGCKYYTPGGKMCAVGRCLVDPVKFQKKSEEFYMNNIKFLNASGAFGDSDLKEEYRGQSVEFWENLQQLHDNEFFWTVKNGLSVNGISKYELIKEKYCK